MDRAEDWCATMTERQTSFNFRYTTGGLHYPEGYSVLTSRLSAIQGNF